MTTWIDTYVKHEKKGKKLQNTKINYRKSAVLALTLLKVLRTKQDILRTTVLITATQMKLSGSMGVAQDERYTCGARGLLQRSISPELCHQLYL